MGETAERRSDDRSRTAPVALPPGLLEALREQVKVTVPLPERELRRIRALLATVSLDDRELLQEIAAQLIVVSAPS